LASLERLFYTGSPMKVACLLIPDFAVAVARRDHPETRGRPLIVAAAGEDAPRVRACCPQAVRSGVSEGMVLRRALSLCPKAAVVPADERALAETAAALRTLAERHSPAVEEAAPGHLHLDVRGLAQLAGLADEAYLADLQRAASAASGLPVSIGAGPGVFAAHAAAAAASAEHAGKTGAPPPVLVPEEGVAEFLAPLPVEVLPLPTAMHQRLRLLGIERLGQLAALPRSAVAAQFGPAGARAWDLAAGKDTSTVVPRRPERTAGAAMELPAPASTAEQLLAATSALLQQALEAPALRGAAWRRCTWRLELESGEAVVRVVTFREPTSDGERMLFVLRQKIARLTLPSPGVRLSLKLSGLCGEYGHQAVLWPSGPRRRRELLEAAEQLSARYGEPQIFRVVEVEPWSRIPERQLALVAFGR